VVPAAALAAALTAATFVVGVADAISQCGAGKYAAARVALRAMRRKECALSTEGGEAAQEQATAGDHAGGGLAAQ
jgi:hypothetical protein